VIKNFAHKGLEEFFNHGSIKGIQAKHAARLEVLLDRLDSAVGIKGMNFPGSGLHRLKGSMKDLWAVKVSGNWRVTFYFDGCDVYVVDYQDYH
jgi:proteic killer suppression protein